MSWESLKNNIIRLSFDYGADNDTRKANLRLQPSAFSGPASNQYSNDKGLFINVPLEFIEDLLILI